MALTLEQRATINTIKEQIVLILNYLNSTKTSILVTYDDPKIKITKTTVGLASYEVNVKQSSNLIPVFTSTTESTTVFRTGKWVLYLADLAQDALDAQTALDQNSGTSFTAFNDASLFPTYTKTKAVNTLPLEEDSKETSKKSKTEPTPLPETPEVSSVEVLDTPTSEEDKNFNK